jgi:hypothetical protein
MKGVRHQPTAENRGTVQAMAGYGIPQEDIGRVLKIDPKTLRLYYAEELATGSIVATAKVAANLFKVATGSGRQAVTAAIFWLKTRAGWSEYSAVQMPKPLGKKAEAERAAASAAEGTDWSDLVH